MILTQTESNYGYESLKAAVMYDCARESNCFNENGCDKKKSKCFHRYCDKFKWVIDRAKCYGSKLNLDWETILARWEEGRNYWYMNYYQDCNQPEIKGDKVRVFESIEDLRKEIGEQKFRCPACEGVSTSPYECNSGLKITTGKNKGKHCDWKAFGLFGTLGKGVFVYCKSELSGSNIFMPVSWENS